MFQLVHLTLPSLRGLSLICLTLTSGSLITGGPVQTVSGWSLLGPHSGHWNSINAAHAGLSLVSSHPWGLTLALCWWKLPVFLQHLLLGSLDWNREIGCTFIAFWLNHHQLSQIPWILTFLSLRSPFLQWWFIHTGLALCPLPVPALIQLLPSTEPRWVPLFGSLWITSKWTLQPRYFPTCP